MAKGKSGKAKMTVGPSSAGVSKAPKGGMNGTQSSNVAKVKPQVIEGSNRRGIIPQGRSRGR